MSKLSELNFKQVFITFFILSGIWSAHVWIFFLVHRSFVNGSDLVTAPVLYISLSIFLLTMIFLVQFEGSSFLNSRYLKILICILSIFGSSLLINTQLHLQFLIFGSIVTAVSMGFLYIWWIEFYAKFKSKHFILLLLLSLVIGSSLKALIVQFPVGIEIGFIIALGPLSIILLMFAKKYMNIFYDEKEKDIEAYTKDNLHAFYPLAITLVFFGAAIGVINGTTAEIAIPLTTLSHSILHGLEVLIGIGLIWYFYYQENELDFYSFWKIILVFLASALFILPYLEDDAKAFALSLLGVAQTIVVIFLQLALIDISRNSKIHSAIIFGAGWILYTFPLALGFLFGAYLGNGMQNFSLPLVLSYALVLLLVFVYTSEPKGVRQLFNDLSPHLESGEASASIEDLCQIAAKHYGLTDRELEVLELFVQGRTKPYIAEALFITENTVRNHTKKIYTKLNVHNKQELIDKIQDVSLTTNC